MQPVVTSDQMRWLDETTIRAFRTPGGLLMDRAGTAAAHLLLRSLERGTPVGVVCGKGNNGGDGFVIARILSENGLPVSVYLTHPASQLKGDSAAAFRTLKAHRPAIHPVSKLLSQEPRVFGHLVDAIFGTGFSGAPRGAAAKAIAWIGASAIPVTSVDIPSGIDATTGRGKGVYVRAQRTVTFGHLKAGLLLNEGRDAAGHVVSVDIGIPRQLSAHRTIDTFLAERGDVTALLPKRSHTLHKYSAGHVLVFAGSKGYTGAAGLCTKAALRSGAGAVTLMTPEAVYPVLAKKLDEEIVVPVAGGSEGTFSAPDAPKVLARLGRCDALVIGPGLGRGDDAIAFVESLLPDVSVPVLIDADALYALAERPGLLRGAKGKAWVLTPHSGEFSRLVGMPATEIETDRIAVSRSFAKKFRTTLMLKGSPTVTASPDGRCVLNPTGNPGMATVGSGDVLAGLIGGLLAQGADPASAAFAGAFIHGMAGDAARDRLGERSVLAGDILEAVPNALTLLGGA